MSFLAALQTAAAEAAAAVAESSIGQTLKSGVETVSDMGAKLDPSEKFNFDPFGGNTGNFSSGFNPNPNPNLNINSNPQAMNDFLSVTNSLNVSNPAAAMMTNLDSGVSIPSINLPQNNANNLSSLEKQELEGFRERFKNIQDVIDADGPYSPEKLITEKEFIPTIVSPQGYLSSPANNNNGMLFDNGKPYTETIDNEGITNVNFRDASNMPSAFGHDSSFIFDNMKLNDPLSVVRESEMRR